MGVHCPSERKLRSVFYSEAKEKIDHEKAIEETILQTVECEDPRLFKSNMDVDMEISDGSLLLADEEQKEQIGIWAARAILLAVAILWGTNFASVKYLETLCFHPPCNHPPSEAALARFGVAAVVSVPLLIGQRLDVIKGGLECGAWITLGYISQAMALETIPSGKCAFICSLTVVVVPLLSSLYGKAIKPVNVVSAIVALLGVGVLEGMIDIPAILGGKSAIDSSTTAANVLTGLFPLKHAASSNGVLDTIANTLGVTKGDIIALGQPFGFGLSFMRIEHYVEKFEHVPNRVLTITAAECMAVGLFSFLWVLYDFNGVLPDFSYMIEWHRIVAVLWTGVMTTVFAIYLEGFALQVASATDAALTFASEPVWASLFGAWLLREQLNTTSYIGGSIILLACVLGAVADLPPRDEEAKDII
eukprot:CAMPEP_0194222264 /NCGR_PEP_ID=MMETSP0156-20130528/32507_1 /TAXON_ID=33649 /ORGANISM="Thalassionema nitzschioides, Strain L26-B" /LENGTH=418 /DNA_ID=CAMNT_0038952979 /DNA_START=133 /DNA_END=1389 /DNA_ORIENTATION=-